VTQNLELKVIGGNARGRVLVIPPAGVTIGRQRPAELILQEPSVSRQHCSIYRRRDHWVVEDLSSQNGTLVNGIPVSKEVLQPGDEIQIGETRLRVPRSMRKLAIAGAAAAAGVVIIILIYHWAAAQPARVAAEEKSASAGTAGIHEDSPDSDLADLDLAHRALRLSPR
jgi:predicted component of type VI protein secretion system